MKKNQLFLGDFLGEPESAVRAWVVKNFQVPIEEVDRFDIIAAHVDDYSYDGVAFFLLQERTTGGLYEVHASHCSCYGFEEQWEPEATSRSYLLSDKFGFSCSYDETRNDMKNFLEAYFQ